MSRKHKKNKTEARPVAARPSGAGGLTRRRYYVFALSAFVMLAASAAATRFDPVRRAVGLRPLSVTPAQGGQGLSLSKEHVYAGGRLVAIEEPAATPTPAPAGPPPTNLVATATSASSVSLTWTPPAGSVIGYVVERRGAAGSQETPAAGTSASFTDNTPSGDYAYLYRVKAVYAGGTSNYGNADLATTVVFTDDSLQGVAIKAAHLTELRRAVNAVRVLVPGLGAASWTYPDPVSSPASQRRAIYLEDVTDLRSKLDEAAGPLGLTTGYPTTPALSRGAAVSAQHFEQIRLRVR